MLTRTTTSTVSASMARMCATPRAADHARSSTGAPSVAIPVESTVLSPVPPADPIFPIVTKLNPDAWARLLEEAGVLEEFREIPKGLREGFLVGLEDFTLSKSHVNDNHFSSPEHLDFIRSKYGDEVALGRLSRGYTPQELENLIGFFRTAPLSVVESKPGKFRVVVNHSFPRAPSPDINSLPRDPSGLIMIDPSTTSPNAVVDGSEYQCGWGTFSECYLRVADAPPGTQAATFDVDAAFRNIPVRSPARNFLALAWDGLVHIDHCLNFGARPSPGIFGRVADALVIILLFKGIQALIKWVDDFIFFCYPKRRLSNGDYVYTYDESLIWDTAEELGWPWALDKFIPFAFVFLYIGFLWDLENKLVSLPEKKKEKYRAKLALWAPEKKMSREDAESIIGTLNHVTLVVPEGRSHMTNLYKFRASFKESDPTFVKHTLPPRLNDDIAWWSEKLCQKFVGMKIIRPPPPIDIRLYVDASTSWGIGLTLGDRWLAWEFKEGWKSDGREIGWAEMVAVDLVLRTLLSSRYSNCHIVIHSDNQGVVGALAAGASRGQQQNLILREIVRTMQNEGIWVTMKWVSTHDNPADAPSRGNLPPRNLLHSHPPALPWYLKPFLHNSVSPQDPRLSSSL